MPTRYWLVGRKEREAVGRLESAGGVRRVEREIPAEVIAATHERYALEREALIDPSHAGPRPSGGVGGTRRGVKCLHAHLAWYLAGGGDPIGRYVALQLGSELCGPVAAIDCGTNSTRLLVMDRQTNTLVRKMAITRLGQGVDETGSLHPDAIDRTLDALRSYREVCDELGVVALRAVTTSAARDAANRAELFDRAEELLGVELQLISGREEGELSYRGATLDRFGEGPALVFDVGGGSTEFAAGATEDPGRLADVVSLDIGCVRLTERYLRSDPPTETELVRAREHVRSLLGDLSLTHPAMAVPKMLIGVAGTVATIATRSVGLADYDGPSTHGARLRKSFVASELALLGGLPVDERKRLPGVEPDRADVIVGGLLVVDEVLSHFDFDELYYSERDILDGLALSLLGAAPSHDERVTAS